MLGSILMTAVDTTKHNNWRHKVTLEVVEVVE